MLTDLHIRNFAIIDHLEVRFDAGFNVLTGETGAGKSIIIDAMQLLLGGRARPELIRSGEEEARIEAIFDLSTTPHVSELLIANDLPEGDELMVRRIVSRSGRNRVTLNGAMATVGQLQLLLAPLLTIYGQHDQQLLQRSERHLNLLDELAGLDESLEDYRRAFREVTACHDALARLDELEQERLQRLDLLTFQQQEIAAVAPRLGEDEKLEAERRLLQNAEKLSSATVGGYAILYGEEGAVCEKLSEVVVALDELTEVDPALAPLTDGVRNALYSLEDLAASLRQRGDTVVFDAERQNDVEERLTQLAQLKRKYGGSLETVLATAETIASDLDSLQHTEARRESLAQKLREQQEVMQRCGETLSQKRQEAASELKVGVERELAQLAMPKANFSLQFTTLAEPSPHGLERGEFYLAPNPGEEPRPLARIASGGELSRIMLALRRVAPQGEVTLIFDEVDAGIGGVAATAVGERLKAVAAGRQVLCITHLPQVAAFADGHFRVEKEEAAGRTRTRLTLLDEEMRVEEMARMLGGAHLGERSREHARELIAASKQKGQA
ncbi:MAG: DNA repair protein RecN [Desulfuromonas sp.]|nr:MAG: DNA repair protein RecN [Desulfuromonas sp.]